VGESSHLSGDLLAGRVALVTGGARGLGAAIARTFAAAGAIGVTVDLEPGPVPDGWRSLTADVTNEAEVAQAVDAAVSHFSRLDAVVANAGVVPPWTETASLDLAELQRVLDVNVRGVAATIKHAVEPLRARGGTVVVMASLNAHRAHPRQHIYTTSKHAVLGLARSAALDLGRYGIRVNAVAPGPVLTEALQARFEHRAAAGGLSVEEAIQEASATALGRMVTEDDVARAALFFASDLSSGITGALLPVDGGLP
jgi:NAD(P)-dependent dehydrogenase (short-subunit alcohol dehydrogenase family)